MEEILSDAENQESSEKKSAAEKSKEVSVIKKPEFGKRRKFLFRPNKELPLYDASKINLEVFELIKGWIVSRKVPADKIESFVNSLYPGKSDLYSHYIEFEKSYKLRIKQIQNQEKLDKLNEIREDMEEFHKFGLSLVKKRAKKTKDNPYARFFKFLDDNIEEIENIIYLGFSPKKICMKLYPKCVGLTPIIFCKWKEETKHIDRLIFAYKCSADEHMYGAEEFMMSWLNDPKLQLQHVGLVREIGLFRSRMAEFMDRKKYGKKVEIVDERPQTKVLEGKDLRTFLEAINSISDERDAPKVEGEESEESEESEEEDLGYTDFEEVTE